MTKATHTGTCQCCGATQKLPDGLLSLHGYTTKYGFFQGTCSGARSLPFEKSKDLIEEFIKAAQESIAENTAIAEELESRSTGKAWHQKYRSHRECEYGQKSGYYWIEEPIMEHTREDGFKSLRFESEMDNKRAPAIYEKTIEEATLACNKRYAQKYRKMIAQAEQYIIWQKDRIANWKPQELTPV